jgi:hypothetical protein
LSCRAREIGDLHPEPFVEDVAPLAELDEALAPHRRGDGGRAFDGIGGVSGPAETPVGGLLAGHLRAGRLDALRRLGRDPVGPLPRLVLGGGDDRSQRQAEGGPATDGGGRGSDRGDALGHGAARLAPKGVHVGVLGSDGDGLL